MRNNDVIITDDDGRLADEFEEDGQLSPKQSKRSTLGEFFRATVFRPNLPRNFSNSDMQRDSTTVLKQNKLKGWWWVQYGVWTVWAFILMLIFGSGGWAYPDGSDPTSCPEDGNINSAMCGMEEVLRAGSESLRFLSSFILGGFVLSSRALWLQRKTAYCALCGATRNLLINVNTLAPPEARKLLARWAILGYELSVLKARFLVDSNEGENYLKLSRLIDGNEWESLVNGDRHTTVWYWIQTKAKQLKDQGHMDAFELQTVCNAVTLSRDKANDLMSCIDRDQPIPYIFACASLINLNLFLHSTAMGFLWSTWMNDAGGLDVFTEPRLYCAVIILYMYTSIFAMLFDICTLLYNPFGCKDYHVPHGIVGHGIRNFAISVSKEGGSIPETLNKDESNNTQFDSTMSKVEQKRISDAELKLRMKVEVTNSRFTRLSKGIGFSKRGF